MSLLEATTPFPRDELQPICVAFAKQLEAGNSPAIEDVLAQAKVKSDRVNALLERLISIEVTHRLQRGEAPERSDYETRFPLNMAAVESAFTADIDRRILETRSVVEQSATAVVDSPTHKSRPALPQSTTSKQGQLGNYELVRELGKGAFGVVYHARDLRLERDVALKVLHSHRLIGADDIERFLREAKAAARVTHPNIVTVYEAGEADGVHFIAGELVDGVTLQDEFKARVKSNQPFTHRESAELVRKLAEAMHHAHGHGVIHRDVKPANVMVDQKGQPLVMDFGLARQEQTDMLRTQEGVILGTPAYMSPEQARGDAYAADARTDLWSLGIMLYELLTGERPFHADTAADLLHKIIHDDAPSPRKADGSISIDLETIVLKCLAKDAEKRYASCQHLADDLNRWLTGDPILERPLGPVEKVVRWCRKRPMIAGAIAVSTILIAGFLFYWNTRPAYLDLQVNPSSAAVSIDGYAVELKNGTGVFTFTPGRHTVTVAQSNYAPKTEEVVLARGAGNTVRLNVELLSNVGHLQVDSTPSDALIEVFNSKGGIAARGRTSFFSPKLPAGSYRVRISKQLYETAEISALVPNGGQVFAADKVELKVLGEAKSQINLVRFQQRMKQPISKPWEFIDTKLNDVLRWIEDTESIEMTIDTRALDSVGIGSDTPVSYSTRSGTLDGNLRFLLRDLELSYMPFSLETSEYKLLISSPEEVESKLFIVRYAIPTSPAEPVDVDFVIDDVTRMVSPNSWSDVGGAGDLSSNSSRTMLTVNQTIGVHFAILKYFEDMQSAASGEPVASIPQVAPSTSAEREKALAEIKKLVADFQSQPAEHAGIRNKLLRFETQFAGSTEAFQSAALRAKLVWPCDEIKPPTKDSLDESSSPPSQVKVLGDAKYSHWSELLSFRIDEKNNSIVTLGIDERLCYWDIHTGKLKKRSYFPAVAHAQLSPDDSHIAGVLPNNQKMAAVWNIGEVTPITTFGEHEKPIAAIAFSNNGDAMATVAGAVLKLWRVDSGKLRLTLLGAESALRSIEWSPTDKRIAAISAANQVYVWNCEKGELIQSKSYKNHISSCAFHPSDNSIVVAGYQLFERFNLDDGANIETGKPDEYPRTHYYNDMKFDETGRWLFVANANTPCAVFDMNSKSADNYQSLGFYLGGMAGGWSRVELSADNKWLVYGRPGGALSVAPLVENNGELVFEKTNKFLPSNEFSHSGPIFAATFVNDGTHAVTSGQDRKVAIWETIANRCTAYSQSNYLQIPAAAPNEVAAYANASVLDPGVGKFAVDGVDSDSVFRSSAGSAFCFAVSGDGKIVAMGTSPTLSGQTVRTGEVAVWNAESKRLVHRINAAEGTSDQYFKIALNPTGDTLFSHAIPMFATATQADYVSRYITAWSTKTGLKKYTLSSTRPVASIAACRVRNELTAVNFNNELIVWDIGTKKKKLTVRLPELCNCVAYRHDGKVIAAVNHNGSIRLYNANSGGLLRTLRAAPSAAKIGSVEFSPEGRHLLTANANGTASILRLDKPGEDTLFETPMSIKTEVEKYQGVATPQFAIVQNCPATKFADLVNRLKDYGYSLTRLRPYAIDDSLVAAAIWERSDLQTKFLPHVTEDMLLRTNSVMSKKGFFPVDVSYYLVNGEVRTAAIWKASLADDRLSLVRYSHNNLDTWKELSEKGRRVVCNSRIVDSENQTHALLLWKRNDSAALWEFWYHNKETLKEFSAADKTQLDINTYYDARQQLIYGSCWKITQGESSRSILDLSLKKQREKWQEMIALQFLPRSISICTDPTGEPISATVWSK